MTKYSLPWRHYRVQLSISLFQYLCYVSGKYDYCVPTRRDNKTRIPIPI